MGRKKKLEKGIRSLEDQHKIHEEKLSQTKDENLKEYWEMKYGNLNRKSKKRRSRLTGKKENDQIFSIRFWLSR